MKFYLDTCIWRDFYEDRFGYGGEPLGRFASDFILKVMARGSTILFSEPLVAELKRFFSGKEIEGILNIFILKNFLEKVDVSEGEYEEAKSLSAERGLPFNDCLFAVQARNHGAVMVTRDRHFLKLSDIVGVKKPEEFT